MSTSLSYRDAGVDIDAGDQLVENIKPFAKRLCALKCWGDLGGFGALVENRQKYKNPGIGFRYGRRRHQAGNWHSTGTNTIPLALIWLP